MVQVPVMAGFDTFSIKLETSQRNAGGGLQDDAVRLEALERACRVHKARQQEQSYLQTAASAVSEIWTHAGQRGEELSEAVAGAQRAKMRGDNTELKSILDHSSDLILQDRIALGKQAQAGQVASQFVTGVPFFMRGRAGALGCALSSALATARPHDNSGEQAVDGTLGAVKGLLLNGAYNRAARLDLSMPVAGVVLGVGSRTLDAALAKESYINGETGAFSPARASALVANEIVNPSAVLTDFAIFASTRSLLGAANRLAAGGIQKSMVWTSAGTGMVTGMTTGALAELDRQSKDGEKFELVRVIERAGESALVMGLAAAAGGMHDWLRRGREIVALPVVRPFDVTDAHQFSLRPKDAVMTTVFENSKASVARILVDRHTVELPQATLHYCSTGSGFVFSADGRIATAYHVVGNAGEVQVQFPGQKLRRAEVEWVDPKNDLAVLKLQGSGGDAHSAPLKLLAGAEAPAKFSDLYGLGYPQGMTDVRVSPGMMRGLLPVRHRVLMSALLGEPVTMWWSHMQVRPGNSGGPVLNGEGEVVGILSKGGRIAPHALMVPATKLAELDSLLGGKDPGSK